MQIYVKSAGFSVNQDYSWVDHNGNSAELDLSILNYNVDGIRFVWKSTDTAIYIFGNAFIDRSRVDLYNRPLRNYILIEGQMYEANYMYSCFAKMLLDQQNFMDMLNSSVCNAGSDSKSGFVVDFQKISAYFDLQLPNNKDVRKLKRHLYERDSYEARKELLNELWGQQRKPITLFIGGELSGQRLRSMSPDRALLDHIDNIDTENRQYPGDSEKHTSVPMLAVTLGAVALASSILVLFTRKKT